MESSDTPEKITASSENSNPTPIVDPERELSKTDEDTLSPSPPPDDKDPPPNQNHDNGHERSDQEPLPANPTEAPPNQEMERSASSYRIPSSVFARSTSTAPMDWSMQSNESLFSIHTGNMSFTNDQYFWRSGELGPPPAGGEASTSGQMFNYNSNHQSAGDGTAASDMRSREMGIAEAVMKEVIKESEDQKNPTLPPMNVRTTHRSHESNASTTSFAFSMMGGETDHHQKGDQPVSPEHAQSQPDQSQSSPLMNPGEPQQATKLEPKSPKATEGAANTCTWFSCLSCCSCCK